MSEDIFEFCDDIGLPREVMGRLLANLKNESLEALSDEDVPLEIHALALRAQEESGQRITAIKRAVDTTVVSGRTIDGRGDDIAWHLRRLTGRALPSDPEPITVSRECWYFVVCGNSGRVESVLKKLGYHALATAPTYVRVCEVGREHDRDLEFAGEAQEFE
jgi:hypothetical protein